MMDMHPDLAALQDLWANARYEPNVIWGPLKVIRYMAAKMEEVRPDIAAFLAANIDTDEDRLIIVTKEGIDYAT